MDIQAAGCVPAMFPRGCPECWPKLGSLYDCVNIQAARRVPAVFPRGCSESVDIQAAGCAPTVFPGGTAQEGVHTATHF